jgi:hypothetical protein
MSRSSSTSPASMRALVATVPVLVAVLLLAALLAPGASAQELADDGNASWQLEQPNPPPPPVGVQGSNVPIGLGKIGDIEFWAPNRGLLITAGNPPTIPAGLWFYNGVGWHELANVCGATDGRIAWAGPEEFWTISDGRPGQAIVEGKIPPIVDNTLCHFSKGHIVGSYASPAFETSSYQPMNAAACFEPSDCWFAAEPLTFEPGAFQLNWNGSGLSAEPNPQGHAVEGMTHFGDRLFESVRIRPTFNPPRPDEEDQLTEPEAPGSPSDLHTIAPAGTKPLFESLESAEQVPVYTSEGQPSWALTALHLGADEGALWGAADPLLHQAFPPNSKAPTGEVTIVRDVNGHWSQVIGSQEPDNPFTKFIFEEHEDESPSEREAQEAHERENEEVSSIAAEPGSENAWLALTTPRASEQETSTTQPARVARISAGGAVSDSEELPSAQEAKEGVGPKGSASEIVCPGPHDCWMATTQGWLFHLADAAERQESAEHLDEDTDPAFTSLITERPHDQGLPQEIPNAPPAEESGLLGELHASTASVGVKSSPINPFATVTLPLLSDMHTRLVHGRTLELSFHLAVKARLRLIAERHKRVVASTPTRTLTAGSRKLLLLLNVHRWPTKLVLQSHALAPLPTTSTRTSNVETVTTSLAFPKTLVRPEPGPLF